MSVSMIRVRTTFAIVPPASATALPMISRQRTVCPWTSPGAAVPPAAAIGAVPAITMIWPTRTARLKPISGSRYDPDEMSFLGTQESPLSEVHKVASLPTSQTGQSRLTHSEHIESAFHFGDKDSFIED